MMGKKSAESGFGIVDALVGLGVASLCIFMLNGLSMNAKKGMKGVEVEVTKMQLAEKYYSVIRNTIAWRQTVMHTASLRNQLQSGGGSSAWSAFPVYDAENNQVIPAAGKFLQADGSDTVASNPNRNFEIRAFWSAVAPNSANVELRIRYVGPMEESRARADTIVKIFKNPIPAVSCMEVERPIVAGSSGAHGNFVFTLIDTKISLPIDPGGNNFVYDFATVQCPADYYLALVYTRPGCNALTSREFAVPSDPRAGSCHQISAQTAQQQTGCGGASPNGTCVARCCTFD